MTDEDKKVGRRNWRLRWLSSIFEFSHLEYQKGLWIDRKYPNEIGWFEEDICQYFDDLSLDDNYESQIKEGLISEEELNSIKDFHGTLDRYIEEEKRQENVMSDSERIIDKEWIAIVDLGQLSWSRLKSIIADREEVEHMIGLEKNYINLK